MRREGQFSSSCSPVPRSLFSDIRHFGGATSRRCLLARNGSLPFWAPGPLICRRALS